MKHALLLLAFVAAPAIGQTDDTLPGALSGRWTVIAAGGRTFIDKVSLKIEGEGKPGPVKGYITWRGVTCGASAEPFEGTWDGQVLRFNSMLRPDVNVQRNGGQCGDGKVVGELQRKAGQQSFSGETRMASTGGTATVSVSPSR
jgi:hypothetical protein